MENLTLDQLKALGQQTQGPRISLYLPTHRASQEIQQDPIRFKNLLCQAEQRLLGIGMNPHEAGAFLQPAQALLADNSFWQRQYEGLAVFLGVDDLHFYRLPFAVEEQLVLARSYYIKPVLPLFTNNGHYYILALSQKEVRLFEGTRYSVEQIDLPENTPSSLEETLQYDDPEKQLQFHTRTPPAPRRNSMFFGHGAGEEVQKDRVERYLNLVDAGLKRIFNYQQAPLVLAGVDYLLPIYRKVSEYANILDEGIVGNPEHLHPEELQQRAWTIVEPYFRREIEGVIEQYQQLVGTGFATDQLEEIIPAAVYGRVDRLFLTVTAQVWGKFNPDTGSVERSQNEPGGEDDLALADFVATQTLQHGGMIYALGQEEMPTNAPMAAIFRY